MKLALSRKNLWERLPCSVRGSVGRALAAAPLEVLLGRRFRTQFHFIQEAQWWPTERIRQYQLRQLRRICALAYERTAFYRRTFDSVGFDPGDLKSLDDLIGLPTIDKTALRKHLDEMCAVPPTLPGVDYVSTGGTGGEPLHFYINADRSATEYAYLVACWQRVGYRPGMPLAVFRGRAVRPNRTGLRHEYDPLLRHHYYSNFHMTDENMDRYLDHVRTLGACFLHVYPSSATALARYLRRSRLAAPPKIRGILAESEIVYPDQRQSLEETFGVRLFACYGHTEKLVLAAECEKSSYYHVWPTYGYFELLDEEGRRVTTPGQRGEIVGTGFINTIVPFIRYRTGDFATYVGERCTACGRHHVLIDDIRGHRTQEFLIAADGSEISWTALNMHDDTFDHVRQFQFYQDTPGWAVLRIVPAAGFSNADEHRIRVNVGRQLDGQLRAEIRRVESIAFCPRGKAIYVDQRIPSAAAAAR